MDLIQLDTALDVNLRFPMSQIASSGALGLVVVMTRLQWNAEITVYSYEYPQASSFDVRQKWRSVHFM